MGRLPFLDHLRWGVIVLVVTLHAAVTYSGVGGWYYHEPAQLDTLSLVAFLVRIVQPIGTDVLNMQLCFFPQYVALFMVGIVAYRRNWLARIPRAFGLFWLRLAVIAGPVLWVGVLLAGRVWTGDYSRVVGGMHWQSGLFCLWESLFCAGVCLGLVVSVRDRFNRHTPLTRFLSDNSFAVADSVVLASNWASAVNPVATSASGSCFSVGQHGLLLEYSPRHAAADCAQPARTPADRRDRGHARRERV